MLSHSYMMTLAYMEGDDILKDVSWFVKVRGTVASPAARLSPIMRGGLLVKIPKSPSTAPMDEVEAYMYTKLLPKLRDFADRRSRGRKEVELPAPQCEFGTQRDMAPFSSLASKPVFSVLLDYYCYFSRDSTRSHCNAIVLEDLMDGGFRPLRPDLCGVVYMRAQVTTDLQRRIN